MKNEWGLFLVLRKKPVDSVAAMNEAIDETYPEAARAAIRAHYPATDTNARDTFIRMVSDSTFRCPTRTMVRYATQAGIPAYLYSFEEGLAWHAMDVPYVFGNPLPSLGVSVVDPLHGVIQSYFAQFARTGDPNVSTQPAWERYDATREPHMTLKAQPAAGAALSKDDCDFWAQLLGD
jgi:para-nitrobenzyl esterase